MKDQLAYVLITPYSLFKSRTGGIIGRMLAHSRVELVAARMFVLSDAFVDAYREIVCPDGTSAAMVKAWQDYVDQVAFVDYNPWVSVYDADPTGVNQPCSDLWRRTFVWWDGRVNPCDVDYLSSLSVGNVMDQSLSDLWTGEAYAKLREEHLDNRREGLMPCRNCSLV